MAAQDPRSPLSTRFAEAMTKRAASDAVHACKGRTLHGNCVVHIGSKAFLLRIAAGAVVECTCELPLLCTSDFTIRGTEEAWDALWQPCPRPGWHDLFALVKRGEMSIEGDMQKVMAHLQYIKDLLTLPRRFA